MPNILTLKVTLHGSKPPIWRRLEVTDDYRLDRFHQVIQIAMGWLNYHLHEFDVDGRRIGMVLPYDSWGDDPEDETKVFLKDLGLGPGNHFNYTYDFGDNWEHRIEVESVRPGNLEAPVCLKGRRAGPPEDCGGVWGYQDLLEIWQTPDHPEYEEYREWLPEGFDPAHFDLDATNEELQRFGDWHRAHPKDKSTPWHQI